MRIVTFLLLFFTLTFSAEPLSGQIFPRKRPGRKDLEKEIVRLKKSIDSLRTELENNTIPLSDTTSVYDTINPGSLSFFDSEDFLDPHISTDSLLNIYYVQKALSLENTISVNLDSTVFTSDIPDSVFIERLKAINSFIPLPYNNVIKNHIIYYTQKIPNKIDLILGLSHYYLPMFEEILDMYDLPKELKIMAIIESALNPRAASRVGAKGIWQFMYRTALQYNLKINSYVDERLDPEAATHAAAKYLKDAYTIFGDWSLAIASYNCGAGNVNKAIRRAGSRDFWTIYPYLPRETRGYVPSFVAAIYALNYYKDHNITPRNISMPAHVDTFLIHKPLHFGQVAELTGLSKEEIGDLNPQYVKEIIPGSPEGMILRVPFNYTTAFVNAESQMYGYKDSLFFGTKVVEETVSQSQRNSVTHRVKSGETMSRIAVKYGVRLSDLQAWNGVKSRIHPGQRLIIYTSRPVKNQSSSGSVKSASPPATKRSGGYIYYTVKKGDTLWDISRKFEGVTLNEIMKLNGLTKKSKIHPGAKIRIKPA
ncbi:MAG: LysM peptidoglycan-binding domain-containing protein [Bacteroidales bacterium]|nr:LysM peptidoglycan-binding domain-containing protein [Bacteroidales bacterium]MDD2424864.1 LysM peptidoglycan-binding domain-containing protein [Bacteroidales bacterium]MDD3990090.1 LysM peptidoglycan-binding domain-containing protein [Bacteroidales bacterium]MDD4638340.1 LysM peptidoglycan-binding domain-containing protein [Bacteroidales bacterium]